MSLGERWIMAATFGSFEASYRVRYVLYPGSLFSVNDNYRVRQLYRH